ncbi:MAG: 2-phospho-L-lactate guanylyltransferase [Myxococcota bacterium]
MSAPRATGVWALIPVRRFTEAKSRLAPALSPPARAKLARQLFDHVLDTIDAQGQFAGVLVATDGNDVARAAEARGAAVLRDGPPQGLGTVIDRGLARLATDGAARALVLMGDLPLLTPADLDAALEAMARHAVVIAPDAEDRGTSALGLSLPAPFATSFGLWDSFYRHRASALGRVLSTTLLRREGLARDVDTPDNLDLIVSR